MINKTKPKTKVISLSYIIKLPNGDIIADSYNANKNNRNNNTRVLVNLIEKSIGRWNELFTNGKVE